MIGGRRPHEPVAPPAPNESPAPLRTVGWPFSWQGAISRTDGIVSTSVGNRLTRLPLVSWRARGGLPVALTLVHNSQGVTDGAFGRKWTSPADACLTIDPETANARLNRADGAQYTFVRNIDGSFTAPAGIVETLTADADGSGYSLLTKGQQRYRFTLAVGARRFCTQLQDKNGNSIRFLRSATGQLTRIDDPSGRTLTFTYGAGADSGRITAVTDPIGRSWSFAYTNGMLTKIGYPAPATQNHQTQFGYNAAGDIVSTTNENGKTSTAAYDSTDRLTTQTDALGQVTRYAYSASACTITSPRRAITVHTYDASGRLLSRQDALGAIESYTYDSQNNRTTRTDPRGKTWAYTYDSRANLLSQTDPLGKTWRMTYTTGDVVRTETTPLGYVITRTYDTAGNLTALSDPLGQNLSFTVDGNGEVTVITDARGKAWRLTYDGYGNPIALADPLGNTTTTTYNALGWKTGVTDPAGLTTAYTYDERGRVLRNLLPGNRSLQYTYDPVGNVLAITSPGGGTDRYAYDDADRRISHTDPLGRIARFTLDADGNAESVTDPRGKTTAYTVSLRGELVGVRYPDGTGEGYAYLPTGQRASHTDGRGIVDSCTYDNAGRLTGLDFSQGSAPSVRFTYDADDRRTAMTDGTGTTLYRYDGAGRLLERVTPQGTVAFQYDAAGQLITRTVPGVGTTIFAYDEAGRPTATTLPDGTVARSAYDAASRLVTRTLPNGTTQNYSYDPTRGDLIQLQQRTGAGTVLSSFGYTYDADGRRISETLSATDAITNTYDAAGQLVREVRTGRQGYDTLYTYDAAGNRTTISREGSVTGYTYDDANKCLSAGSTAFTYDPAGNCIAASSPTETVQFTFDGAGRAIQVTRAAGTNRTTFAYNGLSQRVRVGDSLGVRGLLLQDDSIDSPTLAEGTVRYQVDLQSLLGEWGDSGARSYHADGRGSVRMLTDTTGSVTETRESDAFGVPGRSRSTLQSFQFAGNWGYRSLNDSRSLYAIGYRLYDSESGRFLSRDPIRYGYNPYIYCDNDPINRFDPTGLKPAEDFLIFLPDTNIKIPPMDSPGTPGFLILIDGDDGFPLHAWPVVSGGYHHPTTQVPAGKPTRLPPGNYTVGPVQNKPRPGFTRPGRPGFGFPLIPQFRPNPPRDGFYIHPDGGRTGTQGCIGILLTGEDLRQFYNLLDWLTRHGKVQLIAY